MATKVHSQRIRSGKGKAQAKAATPHQQADLYKRFNAKGKPVDLTGQVFRIDGLLRASQEKINLTEYATQLQWQELDQQPWLEGNLEIQVTPEGREQLKLGHGDVVRCNVRWGGHWIRLWEMRVWDPDRTLQAGSRILTAPLYDDLRQLSLSQDSFHFNNLRCHEVVMRVASKYKIPVGKLAMGTYKIKKLDLTDVSPVDAIQRGYTLERQHSGRRFVMRWNNGKLEVTELRRNPLLYVMHEQLVNVTVHHTTPDDFASSLTGRTSVTDKDGKTHKHMVTVTQGVDAYGYVHQSIDYDKNYDDTELRKAVKQELARRQKIGHTIDFEHRGIALVRKGDAVQVLVPDEGYKGAASIVWVSSITHTLQAGGNYVMQPTVSATDPIADAPTAHKAKNKSQRAQKRRQRGPIPRPSGGAPLV